MKTTSTRYYPKLDILRSIAVILVIISHWFSSEHVLNRYTNNGTIGVTLFFVLSGFLITGILLQYKLKIEMQRTGVLNALKLFYWRRSLRIFPIYYLLLILVILTNIVPLKDGFWWHFFYLSNVYFWLQGSFQGSLSHFWSLAVEEQFYFIWPVLILLIPIRRLMALFIIGVFAAFLYRLLFVTESNEMARFLLPGSIDSFSIGAIFALIHKGNLKTPKKAHDVKMQWLLGFAFMFLAQTIEYLPISAGWKSALFLSILSVAFGWIILACCDLTQNHSKISILNNRILIYLGKISYGLYLYHNFIPYFYTIAIPGISDGLSYHTVQLLRFILLVFIASASWWFVEKPFLQLKEKFIFK